VSQRLREAEVYRAQGFHPIPIMAGSKELALPKGTRAIYERRPPTAKELCIWFPNARKNIALLLGPVPHLLALNVNMKHGHNGMAALNGYTLPHTPTILTPHQGFAFLFRPPDRERYPFPFKTHTAVPGFPPNAIELRGAGGYQLVPSSHLEACTRGDGTIDPAGDYRFDASWSLPRLLHDLDDVPAWLRDLWVSCDRAPCTTAPRYQKRRQGCVHVRISPADSSKEKIQLLSSPRIQLLSATGVLGADGVDALTHDRDLEEACAVFVGLRADGRNATCPLPGHDEANASASVYWNRAGELVMRDWHRRNGKEFWAIPEVYAARTIGHIATDNDGFARSLNGPSIVTWRIRLWVDMGVIDPYPVSMPPLFDDATAQDRRVYDGIWLLFGCKWLHTPGEPTPLGWSFVAGWCGVGVRNAGKSIHRLLDRQILQAAGRYKGQTLYLPGKVQ
jgi:hypothetical protein